MSSELKRRSTAGAETETEVSPSSSPPPVLELDGIEKSYGGTRVIGDLSLSVREGELLTLLGPSGCGKTTTLRLIAGLEQPDAGAVRLDGNAVSGGEFVPPERRDVGVVFQEFALFPHMSARENIAFGIE